MPPPTDPRSFLDRLLGTCITILLVVVVLYVAVKLIERIAVPLLVITGVGVVVSVIVTIVRRRGRGW